LSISLLWSKPTFITLLIVMRNPIFVPMQIILLLTFFVGGCSDSDRTHLPKEEVVAEVNGIAITKTVFLKKYRRFLKRMEVAEPSDPKSTKLLRDKVLNGIITTAILVDEARKAGVNVGSGTTDKEIDNLLGGFSPARLQMILESEGISFDTWRKGIRENIMIENLIKKTVVPLVKVSESDIKEYFNQHKFEFKKKEMVRAYQIVVKTLSEADKIRNDILFGANFEEMAKKYSISPDATNGGDLGVFSKKQMPLEFDNELFKLRINQISKVVESPYGFHIFKVTKKQRPKAMSYFEARSIIHKKMFNERLEIKFREWMKEKREKAKITIYSELLYHF